MLRIALTAGASLLFAGCATNSLYQWGGYEEQLYAAYKDPNQASALRLKLEAHIQAMEQSRRKVAPGLYAEVGTLYLQAGQRQQAIGWYQRERQAWPESQPLMTAMIQNLQRLESKSAAGAPGAIAAPEAAQ